MKNRMKDAPTSAALAAATGAFQAARLADPNSGDPSLWAEDTKSKAREMFRCGAIVNNELAPS